MILILTAVFMTKAKIYIMYMKLCAKYPMVFPFHFRQRAVKTTGCGFLFFLPALCLQVWDIYIWERGSILYEILGIVRSCISFAGMV